MLCRVYTIAHILHGHHHDWLEYIYKRTALFRNTFTIKPTIVCLDECGKTISYILINKICSPVCVCVCVCGMERSSPVKLWMKIVICKIKFQISLPKRDANWTLLNVHVMWGSVVASYYTLEMVCKLYTNWNLQWFSTHVNSWNFETWIWNDACNYWTHMKWKNLIFNNRNRHLKLKM